MQTKYIEKAIITRNYKFSGTVFDAFEYFYRCWEFDKSVHLVTLYNQLDFEFIRLKYSINFDCLKNIIVAEPYDFEFENVLYFDTHCINPNLIRAKNIFVIANAEMHSFDNIEVFSEYFGPKNYKHKVYWEIQRKYPHLKGSYVITQDLNNPDVLKIISKLENPIIKDAKSAFQHFSSTKFTGDFYKNFNELLYIKVPHSFDRHPRIFTECLWQNIKTNYINLTQEIDPSYLRYLDAKNESDLDLRSIYGDIVIEKFLSDK